MRRFFPFAALLGVAFVLGCQDVGTGPVGPDGPLFDVKGSGDCGKPHCHADEKPARPTFTLAVMGGDISSPSKETTPVRGDEIIVHNVVVQLPFFRGDRVTCGGDALPASTGGTLTILTAADPLHLFFQFEHNFANHTISLLATKPPNWPPHTAESVFFPLMLGALNGEWALTTRGQNHQDGCTGAGDDSDDPIAWTATIGEV